MRWVGALQYIYNNNKKKSSPRLRNFIAYAFLKSCLVRNIASIFSKWEKTYFITDTLEKNTKLPQLPVKVPKRGYSRSYADLNLYL